MTTQFKATEQEIQRAVDEIASGFTLTYETHSLTASYIQERINSDIDVTTRINDFLFHGNLEQARAFYFAQFRVTARRYVVDAFNDYECMPHEWQRAAA